MATPSAQPKNPAGPGGGERNGNAARFQEEADRSVLRTPPKPLKGRVGLRESESTVDFPAELKAPKGAPNLLRIIPDDVGFGASSAFGGPVPTPASCRARSCHD